MAANAQSTPLMVLLRACKDDVERAEFAKQAGTKINYLYALAGCHRGQPRASLAVQIEDASRVFHKRTKGRIPVVTVRELASMCSLTGLSDESQG